MLSQKDCTPAAAKPLHHRDLLDATILAWYMIGINPDQLPLCLWSTDIQITAGRLLKLPNFLTP